MPSDPRDIAVIEAFLVEKKALVGGHPIWGRSILQHEWAAAWPIVDSAGVQRGQLRFKCLKTDPGRVSVSLLLRKMMISRIDIVPATVCEKNPHWAPVPEEEAMVCGPHFHRWPDNRAWVEANAIGKLPVRRALPRVRRLSQAVAHLCYETDIEMTPEQLGFETRSDGSLFDPQVMHEQDL